MNTPKTGEFKFEAAKELNNLAESDNLPLEPICTISADIVGITIKIPLMCGRYM